MTRREIRKLRRLCKCLFPGQTTRDYMDLLWGATAFPFVTGKKLHKQIYEAHKEGGGTIEGALEWSHRELDRIVDEEKRAGRWS